VGIASSLKNAPRNDRHRRAFMTQYFPKAFGVWFRQLDRFDPASFEHIFWHWPKEVMVPIKSVLTLRKEKVDRKKFSFGDLQPITIHFGGSIDRREVDQGRDYTMDLFFARPGDIVVAKIDLKNGAVGLVPDWENVVVTNHFAIYEPDRLKLVPEYFLRLIQTSFFKSYLWRNKVGAEGRKEVKLDFFESIEIPLPPLEVQRAVVARWQAAQASAREAENTAIDLELRSKQEILDDLGIKTAQYKTLPKQFALKWAQMERWSIEFLKRKTLSESLEYGDCPSLPMSALCKSQSGGTPSTRETQYWQGDIPWVSPKDMKSWEIYDAQDHISQKAIETSSAPHIAKDSILVVMRSGILQRIVPIALNRVEVSINQDIRAFTLINDQVTPDFLALYLEAREKDLLKLVKWSSTVQSINADDLDNFPVSVPPKEAQEKIVKLAYESRAEIARQRERAAHIRQEAEAEVESLILGTQKIS
jgi:type I restriction enzyme S subunit